MKTMLFTIVIFLAFNASANNQFIPNYYKNRRMINQYSAIGWSVRNEVGLLVDYEIEKDHNDGLSDSESKTTSFTPRAFYRVDENLNIEAIAAITSSEIESTPSNSNSEIDGKTFLASVGYEFEPIPMALGVSISSGEVDSSTNGVTNTSNTSKNDFASVGLGYKMQGQTFLGIGYTYADSEFFNQTYYLNSYSAGIGKVYGDLKNPDGATEVVFTYNKVNSNIESYEIALKGLFNSGAFQYFGELSYDETNSSLDDKTFSLSYGLDYGFGNFFVSPLISYRWVDYEDDSKNKQLSGSLQLGYRTDQFETFLIVTLTDERDQDNVAPFVNGEEKTQGATVAAIYKF